MIKVFLLCGGHYHKFKQPKALTVINGETLLDRTIRFLSIYDVEPIVCCNPEDTLFDSYNIRRCNFTFDDLTHEGYYLDAFAAVPCDEPCIYLFGDVYYTKDAIEKIVVKFYNATKNIFICNAYPFNEQHLRQGEPFGWIVKDQEEFKCGIVLGKKFQDRQLIDHTEGVVTNWDLAHIINGLGVNDFNLRKEDCLIIDDLTIDIDYPEVVERIAKERQNDV